MHIVRRVCVLACPCLCCLVVVGDLFSYGDVEVFLFPLQWVSVFLWCLRGNIPVAIVFLSDVRVNLFLF